MAKNENRFIKVSSESISFGVSATVFVDKQTGVNYLMTQSGYAGGLTPLLDREGKPIITSTFELED